MKDRRLGNTNLIVNVTIVVLIFLELNFRLEVLSYYRTNFCLKIHLNWKKSILIGKSPSQLEKVHLNWKKSISIGKSPSQLEKVHLNWTFSLNRDFITEPILRDLFDINKSPTNAYKKYSFVLV